MDFTDVGVGHDFTASSSSGSGRSPSDETTKPNRCTKAIKYKAKSRPSCEARVLDEYSSGGCREMVKTDGEQYDEFSIADDGLQSCKMAVGDQSYDL
eukprot:gene4015-4561_t